MINTTIPHGTIIRGIVSVDSMNKMISFIIGVIAAVVMLMIYIFIVLILTPHVKYFGVDEVPAEKVVESITRAAINIPRPGVILIISVATLSLLWKLKNIVSES